MKSTRGFSATEGLILLALLILGAAVVVPVYLSHGQKSRQQAARSNLVQWGIALNLYLIENRNELPSADPAMAQVWFNVLPPYLSQPPLKDLQNTPHAIRELWINPAAPKREPAQGESYFFYYGMNAWLGSGKAASRLRIYEVEDPTHTVFMTETFSEDPRVLPHTVDYRFGKSGSANAMAHVLFCDGHVEAIPRSKLSDDAAAYDSRSAMTQPTWVPYYNAPAPNP
ncbi:MAG: hypothetical protein ACFCUX_09540 [Candidatus Methylacidiphilales bacterium]